MKLVTDGVLRGSSMMGAFMIATFTDLILRVSIAAVLSSKLGSIGIWECMAGWLGTWNHAFPVLLFQGKEKPLPVKKQGNGSDRRRGKTGGLSLIWVEDPHLHITRPCGLRLLS